MIESVGHQVWDRECETLSVRRQVCDIECMIESVWDEECM